MRVLHINCNYLGTALHQLMIQHLDDLGINNQVYVPTYDVNKSVIVPNGNVCVSECFKKFDRVFFDYKQKKIIDDIQLKLDIRSFDCIHAYTLFTDGNCAYELSKKYHKPFVVAIRNTDVNTFFKYVPWLRSRGIDIMKNAAAVFFLSSTYKELVLEKYIPSWFRDEFLNKSFVIPNGIDDFWHSNIVTKVDYSKIMRINKREINIIYAGRIDKNKNITTTQKAIALLNANGYKINLTIVGKVDDNDEFEKILKDINTKYIKPQPKEKLIELYRHHDIFVMPSFHETFGLVYAEAISQGLPVVFSKGQGFDGQFSEGTVGFSVNSNDFKDLAKKIELISSNFECISTRLPRCCNRFMWKTITQEYKKIYCSILQKI